MHNQSGQSKQSMRYLYLMALFRHKVKIGSNVYLKCDMFELVVTKAGETFLT